MKNDPVVVKEKVRSYIIQSVHVDSNKIKDSSLIFKEGFLDSMGFIVLISFLEEEFKIRTSDSDLIEENFESINAISDFVIRKSEV
jgi:acyl carrier protein